MKNKTVGLLVDEIGVARTDLVRYGMCFNIDLNSFCKVQQDYFGSYLELHEDGYNMLLNRKEEIIRFRDDFFRLRKVNDICKAINLSFPEFLDFYNQHHETIREYGYKLYGLPVYVPTAIL